MSLRVIAMGMLGAFSAIPLQRMLAADVEVVAVVVPSPAPSESPIRVVDFPAPVTSDFVLQPVTQRNVVQLAREHAIPVLAAGDIRHAQTVSLLRALQPDLIVVACFPFILPRTVRRIPTLGCWNLHPSLLPKLRGPSPLFWAFHEGCYAGVTLHAMNGRADAGAIIAQMPLDFPDGIAYTEAEHACAQWGARLIVDALRSAVQGRLSTQAQDERDASYFPSPTEADFVLTPEWPARRAFNFVAGVQGFGGPCTIQAGHRQFVVNEAIAYRNEASLSEAYRVEGDRLRVRCVDGVLEVRLKSG